MANQRLFFISVPADRKKFLFPCPPICIENGREFRAQRQIS
jgi:hypothetical protein